MKDLKGRTEQEIMDAFIDKYKIHFDEWEKLTLYLKGPEEKVVNDFIKKWNINFKDWEKMVSYLKNPSGELKIGDVVKFKHETRTLGVINYIQRYSTSANANVYSRDGRGVIKYLKNIDTQCLEIVQDFEPL